MSKEKEYQRLESLFESARKAPPEVPQALMRRVLTDAEDMQPRVRQAGWLNVLGGLPGLGGLVTATCVGVWIGVAPPEGVAELTAQLLGGQDVTEADTFGFGWDIEEG